MAKKKKPNPGKGVKNTGKGSVPSDVQGSYTGMGIKGERPVQDADDL